MVLEELKKDKEAMDCISQFFSHPGFAKVRIAFTNHTPKGDITSETSVSVSHGQNLGTRYVFNWMEENIQQPAPPPRKRAQGGPDPDLA